MHPLINKTYLLNKFSGKGGWTYAEIPEIAQNKNNPFGWVKVKGSVDDYQFPQYKLMPMGNGKLFFPVKAAIRKMIKKEAGDQVHITLWLDDTPFEIPQEILECFANESSDIYTSFLSLSEGKQKTYIDNIYAAKTDKTKISRIVKMMEELSSTTD